ncbi:hypothetical protein GGP89_003559 [Salinibacter ruber]|uniref:Uncharacterized protein n=1 Tax=Salinibacter ruber TaxID=146919 RepID=A0A9X2Z1T5_9BACT|nr:hypothetical protein [Salinibacter ruber]MCS3866994.1 hypothetical protein [Salinibacter ruber]
MENSQMENSQLATKYRASPFSPGLKARIRSSVSFFRESRLTCIAFAAEAATVAQGRPYP